MAIPLFTSTNPSHVNLLHLTHLFRSANFSCHRFPNINTHGDVEAVDPHKLRVALDHSSVLVSVFCKPPKSSERSASLRTLGDLFREALPVTQSNGRLVGFGRAVSDNGLTASIHDVVVLPSLQRQGIGSMIVKRIVRMLIGRGIYDVSALCSCEERLFFEACGFGNDMLGSTTMIYTRGASQSNLSDKGNQNGVVKGAGRMLLLVPPPVVVVEGERP
ncbi:hypothetical protein Sjap_012749 [Stephania japonica]|uniref:N-acetyltransferase domain-containing protein n=1 Tax=Stephania japonica TaxID=461633 RepID=A0AAP0IWH1_9MAGN